VLLAACTNLASMLAARATGRQRELAIRLAIGAGRGRVVRQVLIETLTLSLVGGGSGYVLATVLAQLLSRWRAPMDFPVQFNVNPDWRVFLFALMACIVAGGLFGCAPAWRASRTDPNAVLKGSTSNRRTAHLSFGDVLVVVQVAVCFVLVAACLLSLRGLQQAFKLNLGFEPQHVSVVGLDLGLPGYSEERGRTFQQQALETIQQLPGVESASYSNSVPLSIDQSQTRVFPADKPDLRPTDRVDVTRYQISPGFFTTLGTKLLAGRDFTWHDDNTSPSVAIVNVAFTKQVLHSESAVGKRFLDGIDGHLVEVVGVVEDGKYASLTESQMPAAFWPMLQFYNGTTTLEVRSALPATQIVGEIRAAISRLDPGLPLYGASSLEQMLGLAFFPSRAAAIALSAFGALAIVLAATGIHGLMAYSVSKRAHEIGIRMALGATPLQVLRLVLSKTATLLLLGSVVGLSLALAMGPVIASVVYLAHARDPLVVVGVLTTIVLLGFAAAWSPARRAARVDPMVALHHE
jgi:predicted permease